MADESLADANANDLLSIWRKICPGGQTIPGRDSKLLKELLQQEQEPVQLIWAMVLYSRLTYPHNVWVFTTHANSDAWFGDDPIVAGVELLLWLGDEHPQGYYTYLDYNDGLGAPRVELEREYQDAKTVLKELIDERLAEYTITRGTRVNIRIPKGHGKVD